MAGTLRFFRSGSCSSVLLVQAASLPRPTKPGLSKLRCGRVLEEGMVVTVEPGCYFIRELLEPAFATYSDVLCVEKVRELLGSGGVRIEDDVEVTASGARNLTASLPRTVAEIEEFMLSNNPHIKASRKK